MLQGFGKSEAELTVSVGVSTFIADPDHLNRGYQEALVALKVSRRLNGPGGASISTTSAATGCFWRYGRGTRIRSGPCTRSRSLPSTAMTRPTVHN